MQEKTFEVAFAWISSDLWFVEKFRGRAWNGCLNHLYLPSGVLNAGSSGLISSSLIWRNPLLASSLENTLASGIVADYFLYGSHSLRIMLTLDDLVQVTGGGYRSGFCRLDWNFHLSDQLGWLCCLDYVSFWLPFHGSEFVHGGVRFQFNCVGSRQCPGCLSEVWELVKSLGNLISLGSGGRVNGF